MSQRTKRILLALALIALYLIVSDMSYDDEVAQEEAICDGVVRGYYPAANFPFCGHTVAP